MSSFARCSNRCAISRRAALRHAVRRRLSRWLRCRPVGASRRRSLRTISSRPAPPVSIESKSTVTTCRSTMDRSMISSASRPSTTSPILPACSGDAPTAPRPAAARSSPMSRSNFARGLPQRVRRPNNPMGHEGHFLDGRSAGLLENAGFMISDDRLVEAPWQFETHGQAGEFCRQLFWMPSLDAGAVADAMDREIGFFASDGQIHLRWQLRRITCSA